MNSFDDITRIIQEQERLLNSFRGFESMSGIDLRRIQEDVLQQQKIVDSLRSESFGMFQRDIELYQKAVESFRPEIDWMSETAKQLTYMEPIAEAHSSLSRLISQDSILHNAHSVALEPEKYWRKFIEPYPGLVDRATEAELALKSHYASMAEPAFLAQEMLLRFSPETFGLSLGFTDIEIFETRSSFSALTIAYCDLMRSFEEKEHTITSFPPIVSYGPPIEIYTSVNTLRALSFTQDEESNYETESQGEHDLKEEIEDSLEELLEVLDPGLRNMLKGAKEALDSNNSDRKRHVAVSLRELLTHVLHRIAPNDEIESWTTDPKHYNNGKPTREARVLYACRGVNHGPFANFISADVKASIEFINLFQRGTHEICINFTESQLKALFVRAESFLRFLLLTYNTMD